MTNKNAFSVGITQTACSNNTKENCQQAEHAIANAAKQGAQIICLQELFHYTYFCTTEDHSFYDLAEAVDGPIVSSMQKLAQKLNVVIVVPFFERRAPGIYHNSAAVIDADGSLLGLYRKMHIPDDPLYLEKFYFTPGDCQTPAESSKVAVHNGFKVFSTRYAKIGVLICWDQWYPEAARTTALLGAEVLFYPTAIGWHPFEKDSAGPGQTDAWQTIQRSHSVANGLYVASPNRIGHEKTQGTEGIVFFGHSFISDPFGKVVAQASNSEPATLIHSCDRTLIEQTRRNWPFLRDRRIDAYSGVTARYLG